VDGQPVPPLAAGPALPEALVEISRLEPLIAAVERACGRVLEPVEIGPPPPGLMLELELTDGAGALRHLARLALSPGLRPQPSQRPPGRLDRAARARVTCRLTLQGPKAPRGELASLEAGDVVVIPHGPGARLPALLEVGNMSWRGGFQPDGSALHIEREDHRMLDDPPSPEGPGADAAPAAPHEQASSARFAELPVRLEVVLPSLHLSVGELAALAPGSVTALPVTGEDLAVRLLTEGVEIASGRLVALGSGYGVLVETVSEPATAGTAL
jgi:flagellar motor switch/type III secretory pathway protein FliN